MRYGESEALLAPPVVVVRAPERTRRLIRGGGARINDVAVSAEARIDGAIKLSAGCKQHLLLRPI